MCIASRALTFIFSVSTLSFANPVLVSRSSLSPFFIPINFTSVSLGLSVIATSTYKLLPTRFVKYTCTSAIRFCFQSLVMALLNTSDPGIITLSPTASPEIDMIRFGSKDWLPVTEIPAMIYSFGGLLLNISISCGLTETRGLSVNIWAPANWVQKSDITINKKFW